MRGKRTSKLLLILSLVFILILSACSSGNSGSESKTTPTPTPSTSTSTPSETPAPSEGSGDGSGLPIVDQPMTLRTWVVTDGNFRGEDYNEKVSFQKMQELTNIEIDWVQGSGANGPEAFNLLMASGQLPDMVWFSGMMTEAPKYGQQGAFVDLAPYIQEHAPNFAKILEEYPDVRRMITTPDGQIFHFPQLNLDEYLHVQMFPQVRQDWLDKLNIAQPETTEDWYNMLKAFKTQDPNGNGQADEIPFVSVNLQNMFRIFGPAFGTDWEFYVDNGKVKFGPNEPEYKEALQYLSKLYAEGLIDPNYLVDTEFKFLTEKVTTDRAGAWVGWSGSYMTSFTNLMQDHPTFHIEGTVAPKGPNGHQRYGYHGWPVGNVGIAISAKSKNIVEAVKWLDFQYTEEAILLNNFGVEGVSYDMVDGYPTFRDVVLNNPNGLSSTEALLSFTIGGGSWSTVSDRRYQEQYDIEQAIVAKAKISEHIDYNASLPPFSFTAEQNDIIIPLLADIRTFRDEYANQYVMGTRDFAKYEAEFVDQLKKMNVDKVLEVYQAAYDEYISRS